MGSESPHRQYQKIVTTGFLIRDGKALIAKRSETEAFLPGYYDLPGGKCEFGEHPEVAMQREFREETGLVVAVIRPYRTFSYLSDGDRRHTVEIVFLLSEQSAEPIQLGPDHSEVAWVTSRLASPRLRGAWAEW
ncbi:NUDIX domain-containing protein [Candidatus Berkelbacteria bacterium]|nr:NUDIX domain-containing protein [Candidatus Berkelbacteria bacterium]